MRKNEIKQNWGTSTLRWAIFLVITLLLFMSILIFSLIKVLAFFQAETKLESDMYTIIAIFIAFVITVTILFVFSFSIIALSDYKTQKKCLQKLKKNLTSYYKTIKVKPDSIPEYSDIILSGSVKAKIDKTDIVSLSIVNLDGVVIDEFSTLNYKWLLSDVIIL